MNLASSLSLTPRCLANAASPPAISEAACSNCTVIALTDCALPGRSRAGLALLDDQLQRPPKHFLRWHGFAGQVGSELGIGKAEPPRERGGAAGTLNRLSDKPPADAGRSPPLLARAAG